MKEDYITIGSGIVYKKTVLNLVSKNRKIKAIKYIKDETGIDLLDAKNLLDQIVLENKTKPVVTNADSFNFIQKENNAISKEKVLLFIAVCVVFFIIGYLLIQ